MDITKDQAEKIAQRSIGWCKELADATQVEEHKGLLKNIENDVAVLALAVRHRLGREDDYRITFNTLSEENVRLHQTITTLAEQLTDIGKYAEEQAANNEKLLKYIEDNTCHTDLLLNAARRVGPEICEGCLELP